MRATREYFAPQNHGERNRLPLRESRHNPLVVLGDVTGRTGCCARRVLVHHEHSPPVHKPDGWRTGLAIGPAV